MRQLLTLSFFYFFYSCCTYAQVTFTLADTAIAQRLISESSKFRDKRQFDSALIKADSALFVFEKLLGNESIEVADALQLKAISLLKKNKLEEALSHFERTLSIRTKLKGAENIIVANSLFWIGSLYKSKREYDKSLEFSQKALAILSKEPISEYLATTYSLIATLKEVKGDFIQAIELEQKALDVYNQISGENSIDVAFSLNAIGTFYYKRGDFDKASEYFNKSLDKKIIIYGSIHPDLANSYSSLGNLEYAKGNIDKSLDYFQKAIEICDKSNLAALSVYYNNIGNSYSSKFDDDKARLYFLKALEVKVKLLGLEHPDLAVNYYGLGRVYVMQNNFKDAIDMFKKSLELSLKSNGGLGEGVAINYSTLSNCYNKIGEYDKALDCVQKALDIQLKTLSPNSIKIGATYHNLGYAYEAKKEYAKAFDYYKKAFAIFIMKSEKVQESNKMAFIKLKQKEYEVADSLYNLSLIELNYSINHNLSSVASLVKLSHTLLGKANFEYLWFKATNNVIHLKNANNEYQNALDVVQYQSKTIVSESSKLELKFILHEITEGLIQTGQLLSVSNTKTFEYNEQTKSGLLQGQLKESDALKYANIPLDLLKKEYDLRLIIASNETQKQSKINAGKSETDSSVLAISSKLFDLKQDYEALKLNLEKNYPDYYRLKYDLKTVSVDDVQKKMLSPQQTLLSYFVGDSSIFAFVVRPDTFAVFSIKKDFPLELWVKQLRDGLYGYQTAAVKTEKLYDMKADSFAQAAFQLHQKLITPLSILLTKEVIIIPDGVLGYVPFDVLLSDKPTDATKFNTHRYFGKEHIVSYNYSATLWQEMQNKKHKTEPSKNFVGFAPYYNGDTTLLSQVFANDITMRKGLDSLKYSGEEVYKAQKLMGGESVLSKKATKKTFEETVGNYRIIHLATHGKANDKTGDYCFLIFSEQKDSINNALLYVRDIYNLSLNADLVTLSACETGIGELKRGEGIVSLARAFAYAGAKSMITTLWSVNDKSTMQIMENFYRNLRKGQTKDAALWRAKQDYLGKANGELAHPFFWSSFIPIGDMKPLKILP